MAHFDPWAVQKHLVIDIYIVNFFVVVELHKMFQLFRKYTNYFQRKASKFDLLLKCIIEAV